MSKDLIKWVKDKKYAYLDINTLPKPFVTKKVGTHVGIKLTSLMTKYNTKGRPWYRKLVRRYVDICMGQLYRVSSLIQSAIGIVELEHCSDWLAHDKSSSLATDQVVTQSCTSLRIAVRLFQQRSP